MIKKIRMWLIKVIAGKDICVAMNLNIRGTINIKNDDNKCLLICGNYIEN